MPFAVLFAVLLVVAVALAVSPPSDAAGVRLRATADRRRTGELALRGGAGVCAGMLVTVVSGWVLAGGVVAAGAFALVGGRRRRRDRSRHEIERLDALASWIENVRDVLVAGEQPIGAIVATVATCPAPIRPEVRRLATGLTRLDPEVAFRRFADDLDDPLADLTAAGLAIAVRRGARTVPVLTSLADQARQQVERRRLIEAERAPARREVQALTAIMGSLVLALLVLGRSDYLDAYDTTAGQLFLALMLAGYAGLLVRVQRLAAFPRPGRFLSAASIGGAS